MWPGAWFFPAGDVVDVEVLPACVLNPVIRHGVISYLIAEPHVAGPDIQVHAIPVVVAVADPCNPQPKLLLEVAAGLRRGAPRRRSRHRTRRAPPPPRDFEAGADAVAVADGLFLGSLRRSSRLFLGSLRRSSRLFLGSLR